MSEKPIDLQKRRSLIARMARLEQGVAALRRELATPDQLTKIAYGQLQVVEKHFAPAIDAVKSSQALLLELMTLHGAIAKLQGHDPDPSDALAIALKNTDFLKDEFKKSVLARIAKLEDECIQS